MVIARNPDSPWAMIFLVFAGAISPVDAIGAERLHVVTSTTDLASLVQEVGGDYVDVTRLARGYQDPHFVPVDARSLLQLNRADLLLVIGLQMENAWLGEGLQANSLLAQCRNPRIQFGSAGYFDLSPYIQVLEVPNQITRALGIHPLGNPHYWLDPENGRRIARAISTKLGTMRPGIAAYFEQRFRSFDLRLAGKERLWAEQMKPYRGYKVITYHRAWSSFLDRFGLISVGEIEPLPGVPPNRTHIDELIQEMKPQKVRAILVEPCYELSATRRIAHSTGVKVLVLPASVGGAKQVTDYFGLFDYDIGLLKQTLK